jgi:dTDP-glucose pyrophosphorylase
VTKVVIDNLRPPSSISHQFIFVILQEHIDEFQFDGHLKKWIPGCVIVPVREVTQGAACTVLLARENIDNDNPLMIANCDQWVDVDMSQYLLEMEKQSAEGIIMTMTADDPKWSYCRFNEAGKMTEVVEKQVVSNEATVGIYNFRHGRDFVAAADEMIAADLRVNGEFYVAPTYNRLIAKGKKIVHYNVGSEYNGMYGLGIPKDLEYFSSVMERLVGRLMRMSKMEGRAALLGRVANAVGLSRDTRVTFHERPRFSEHVQTVSDPMRQEASVGIVMQGPIFREDDFTLNSVQLYRRHFPSASIIVSTWDTEDARTLDAMREAGAVVVTSRLPIIRGPANLNCQMASTLAGITRCREIGVKYILKTRNDERFYAPNALEYLRQMMDIFPVAKGYGQKARIIGVSLDTFKYRLYGMGDHLQFGTLEDMHHYWSAKHDERKHADIKQETWMEACLRNTVEVYLETEFLAKIGRKVQWTLQDSLAAYADHFCVVDQQDIDLYWPKYEPFKENRMLAYDFIHNTQELTFRDWLLLYRGAVDIKKIPEKGLHVPYGGRMF